MPDIHIQYVKTKIGDLIVGSYEQQLCLLDFRFRKMRHTVDHRLQALLHASYVERDSETVAQTMVQLNDYLLGHRQHFDVPLVTPGSAFQQNVWRALQTIPYGKTTSYRELAIAISQPTAVRAVAAANGANAISVIIPCHRVIGSNGELVGYGGGLPVKKRLLGLEQSVTAQRTLW